ncbi:MAG: hypothetical protein R3E39_23370 [Anaerolineae bacterium]
MILKAPDGYFHPRNEAEICELVKHAAANRLKVRVRGSDPLQASGYPYR